MIHKQRISQIIEFIKVAEKLKTELRHSYTSDVSRKESVAEHTWMSTLIAMLLFKEIDFKVDELKTLKMIVIHDLGESITGDIPAFEISERQNKKIDTEREAYRKLTSSIPNKKTAKEIYDLWEEFEESKTPEAKLAKAIDKVDVLLQHCNTDISTWDEGDFGLNPYDKDERFEFDQFLESLKEAINYGVMKKVEDTNNLHRVGAKHLAMWKEQKKKRSSGLR